MSTLLNIIRRVIAIIKMPRIMADKIARVQAILLKLTNNATFPAASWPANIVSFAQFSLDVTAFVNAESAVLNKTGTVAARNAALVVVMTDLRGILSMVQAKADANPGNAAAIIGNAGFFVKGEGGAQKRQNAAFNSQLPGTVILTADGTGHHQWEMSKDQVAITTLPPTSTSKTTVSGLTFGDTWYFRSKKVDTKKKTYNWCAWIQLKINAGGHNIGGGTNPNVAGNMAN